MRRAGIVMGRPRVGALSVEHDGRTACDYSNTEFWQDQPYLYTPAVTIRKLIANGKLDYCPGFFVESYEEHDPARPGADGKAPIAVKARELATDQQIEFEGDVLLLAGGVIGTTKIVLTSHRDVSSVLPLLENPCVQVPFVIPSAIGRRLDTHSFGLTQLNLIWDPTPYGCLGQGSILEITSPMRAEFFGRFPLSARANVALIKTMLPAMVVMQLYFAVSVQGPASLSLKRDGGLRIAGKPNAIDVRKLGGFLTSMRRLGLWTHPMLIYKPETGHAIHYAGTLPMRVMPGNYECWPDGRLAGAERVYVADSAGFSDLPAKNMSFGMMTNAMRVAGAAVTEAPAVRVTVAPAARRKTVLITGASGFIAGHISRRMAAEGWDVFGVDRPGAPALPAYKQVFPVALSESMAAVLAQTHPDAILHTALDPAPNRYDVNVGGTRRWLGEGQAAGVGVQVLLSSLSAAENALAEYGRGKWELEQAFHAAGEVAVRLGVVVGRGGMFAGLVESARRSPVIPMLGGGQQLLYVLGVERLAEILRDIVASNGESLRERSWNLPQPQPYTLRQMMDAIVRGYGFKRVTLTLPIRPVLLGVQLLERQPLVRLPVSSSNVKGLMQAGRQTFPSDYPRFGYQEQGLHELVKLARTQGA
jgi:nucleoside-diphosphate-sugar epimerase